MQKFGEGRHMASFKDFALGMLIMSVTACSTVSGAGQEGTAADRVAQEQQTSDRRTEQLCHDLLHAGTRPANAASNPQRCE